MWSIFRGSARHAYRIKELPCTHCACLAACTSRAFTRSHPVDGPSGVSGDSMRAKTKPNTRPVTIDGSNPPRRWSVRVKSPAGMVLRQTPPSIACGRLRSSIETTTRFSKLSEHRRELRQVMRRGTPFSRSHGEGNNGRTLARSRLSIGERARSNCHMLLLSMGTLKNFPTASMPAATRPHCILGAKDLQMLAFVCGLCRWSANLSSRFLLQMRILLRPGTGEHSAPSAGAGKNWLEHFLEYSIDA